MHLNYQVAHKPLIKNQIEMLHLSYQFRIYVFILAMWFLHVVVFGPILAQVSALTDPLPSALSKWKTESRFKTVLVRPWNKWYLLNNIENKVQIPCITGDFRLSSLAGELDQCRHVKSYTSRSTGVERRGCTWLWAARSFWEEFELKMSLRKKRGLVSCPWLVPY